MEPIAYLQLFRRRWLLLATATLLGIGIGLATGHSATTGPLQYEATHTLSVLAGTLEHSGEPVASTLTPSQMAVFVDVGAVPEAAVNQLDYRGTPQELAGKVTATADDTLGTIEITATDSSPGRAVAIANAVANQLKVYVAGGAGTQQVDLIEARRQTRELERQISALDAQIAADPTSVLLTARRAILASEYETAFDRLRSLEDTGPAESPLTTLERAEAQAATRDGGPRLPTDRLPRAGVLGLIGLALGAALVIVLDRLDTRIHTKGDAEAITGMAVFAEIPHLSRRRRDEPIAQAQVPSPFVEAYRGLRTTLSFTAGPESDAAPDGGVPPSEEPAVILVTSPGPGEGKSTTVAWLAAAYAESGRSVLVLDCDFRRPRLHHLLETSPRPGLSDSLMDPSRFNDDGEIIRPTPINGVRLIPAGTPTDHAAQLFTRARRLIEASRGQADVVLIDTPPFLVASDAAQIIPFVDATLVVLRSRRSSQGSATRLAEQLDRYTVPVLGIVLLDIDQASPYYGGYYSSGEVPKRRWPGRRGRQTVGAPEGTAGADGTETDRPGGAVAMADANGEPRPTATAGPAAPVDEPIAPTETRDAPLPS